MSGWEKYRASRTSWGINVLGSFCVEIEASDGTRGFATGFGGPPACWLVKQHFERFLIGAGMLRKIPYTTTQYFYSITKIVLRSSEYKQLVRIDVPRIHVLWT